MDKLGPILIGALLGLMLGGAVTWFVTSLQEPSKSEVSVAPDIEDEDDASPPTKTQPDSKEQPDNARELEETQRKVAVLETKIDELEGEKSNLTKEVARLETRNTELESNATERDSEIEDDKQPSNMRVAFGQWGKLQELREADWKELGETYAEMTKLASEVAAALKAGEPIDPATQAKRRNLNQKLVKHYIKIVGKLPTHATVNGEFSHPINLVNILAKQLEAADDPLSEAQISQLQDLGEKFDERWKNNQDSYDENTWELQKLLDEAELKEWFRVEMFRATTPQQKVTAVPPELEGMMNLDMYAPGLIFNTALDVVQVADTTKLKDTIKTRLEKALSVERSLLDNAEYLFDEWTNELTPQLQPIKPTETQFILSADIITAGRAQLSALQQFARTFVTDAEKKEGFREISTVLFPQIVSE